MASKSREVLDFFEENIEAVSSQMLAYRLEISLAVLEGILDYWVRNGELREIQVDANSCQACTIQKVCPFVIALPRYYERVRADSPKTSCVCAGQCK